MKSKQSNQTQNWT